eukprot:TRINITY_DN2371_c0_g1_i2.p1 TRINITY_DN2371_c0_g1~~TRINITY_DN2371_c0_g1_i2.p1  ORF type:complete len:477 (+),score=136.75 TRINITY_DN2371_c0_g1_i2:141-1433(+)
MSSVQIAIPKKDFSSVASPPRTVISLKDVMDEELAHKLHEEQFPSASPQQDFDDDDLDEELKLALALSESEAKQASLNNNSLRAPENPEPVGSEHSVDRDFLLALELQNQINDEQYARHLQEKLRSFSDPQYSKVSLSYDPNYHGQDYKGHDFYDANDDLEEDSDEDLDFEASAEANLFQMKMNHQAVKPNGREPAGQFITKHDIIADSTKNAVSIEKFLDSGNMEDMMLSTKVYNSLKESSRHQQTTSNRVRGNRIDKSTSEQVMDQRTRVNLLKLLNSDLIASVHGVISTGKEANVYHGFAGAKEPEEGEERLVEPGNEIAIKIYKTTLNEFKNRSEYVEGEWRFRHKTSKHNPRKLIKLWAEKEMRNLKRLRSAGVPCPTPVALKDNILVMGFIGKEGGFAAPILKDVELPRTSPSSRHKGSMKFAV